MHRTQTTTLVFALAASLLTVGSSWFAYGGLRAAFEREFQARLAKVARIAASQITAAQIDDMRRLGAESNGYFDAQAQLDMLRSITGFTDLAIVDTTRRTLYDARQGEIAVGERSEYDSLASPALGQALRGTPAPAPPLRRADGEARAAFAPVRDGARVVAVLAAEAEPEWEDDLDRLRRRLFAIAAVSVAAILVLAGIVMRAAGHQVTLERRLSRTENLAAMGRMTATLAHEIKNPLAIIRGSARRLGRLEPEAARMAESVVEEVDRLSSTVSRFLQFARGEAEGRGAGDFGAALGATLDLLGGEFQARGCALERDLAPDPLTVPLDPESLKQVCLNLLLNALEAPPAQGRVRVSLAGEGRRVVLRVSDNGPGIPPEVLRRIGDPFFTTRAQGTGLGLFLTRRLLEGAGGTLRLDSAAGRGTTVTVDLPRVGGPAPAG